MSDTFLLWSEVCSAAPVTMVINDVKSSVRQTRPTFDDEVGVGLEVLGGEFDLSGFIQLDVPQSQAVDFILCLHHHLSDSTETVTEGLTCPEHGLKGESISHQV